MEEEFIHKSTTTTADATGDNFFSDAMDDFPFYDSLPNFEPDSSPPEEIPPFESTATTPEFPSPPGLSRRPSIPAESNRSSPVSSNITSMGTTTTTASDDDDDDDAVSRYRKYRFSRILKENEKSGLVRVSVNDEENHESSLVTSANDEQIDEELNSGDSLDDTFSVLLYLAGLVVKAIGFQMNLLVSFVTFPVWFIYSSYMFVTDPFRIGRRIKSYFLRILLRILGEFRERITSVIFGWAKENHSTWKLILRLGWGLLWSAYVCLILAGLFVSAFIFSGIIMSYIVEEPLQMKEDLNFDYTKDSPVAFVPIISCPEFFCVDCRENTEIENIGEARVIPPKHHLQATVSLRLPESDYNRNLGIFQVRVDFLSANGKPLASKRQATMLQFKSLPIRLLLTFFKMAPLATGYLSETQTLNIKFRGFTEKQVPTSCLRVVMEQRAEFHAGAGIPEIYEASLDVESELPLLKRVLWSWKKTIFVWISIMIFTVELVFTLVCCTSILVPRVQLRGGSSGNNNNINNDSNNNPSQSNGPAPLRGN